MALIFLFGVRTARLRSLLRLGFRLFLVTKPWWQVVQGRLSVTDRRLKLCKIDVP